MSKVLLLTMRCAKGGEEWPTLSYQMTARTDGPVTGKSVIFICPGHHQFTLEEALSKGIFTQEEAKDCIARCEEAAVKARAERNRPDVASDYLSNEEVAKANLPCVKCGKKALWGDPANPKTVLCLDCRAGWHNYDHKGASEVMDHTSGKPWNMLWRVLFERFLKDLPAPDREEAEKLLSEFRKQSRQTKRRTVCT